MKVECKTCGHLVEGGFCGYKGCCWIRRNPTDKAVNK